MIVAMGDATIYGPSLAMASPAAQAHQRALNAAAAAKKKKKATAATPSSSTALVPIAAPAAGTQWPYVLGGLAVLVGAWFVFLRRPKRIGNPRRGGRRRSGRPFARGHHGRFR